MDKVSGKLTVLFDELFWTGVFERMWDGRLSACKVTFGAEPKAGSVRMYRIPYILALFFF